MEEKEFNEAVYKATGKILGKDYGFILGKSSPYKNSISGTQSNSYIIWKVEGNKGLEYTVNYSEDHLQTIIDFLNSPMPEDEGSETKIIGEYE